MLHRSRTPLRLGLAGGGTDVSPYSDIYGGAILNSTINLYAYASIRPTDNNKIIINAIDRKELIELHSLEELEINGKLDLVKGVYNRLIKDFIKKPLSFEISTYVDAPAGSGLGSSSTLTVSIIGAFVEWLKLPLGEYDIAHLAYEIERKDLGMAGGKQDQYAATFGGFNYMEFSENEKVIVNPLRIKQDYINEMEMSLLLYYTGTSRLSANIIDAQTKNIIENNEKSIEGMHKLKEQAKMMKNIILKGDLDEIGEILDYGWKYKKQLTASISNPLIDELYETAVKTGATGGKISGAGGGGFMMFYCPANTRYSVMESLKEFGGEFKSFSFTKDGLTSWTINN